MKKFMTVVFGLTVGLGFGQGAVKSKASHYGGYKLTASGERFNPNSFTAAHKTLPFNSVVRVKNTANDKQVDVRINNRGPFKPGRDLDLTKVAFKRLAPLETGVISVEYDILSYGDNKRIKSRRNGTKI